MSPPGSLRDRHRVNHNVPFGCGSDGMSADWDSPPDRMPLCVKGWGWARVVGCGLGRGVACPKSRLLGCDPAALVAESFPYCPPGSLAWTWVRRASIRRRVKTASLTCRLRARRASRWVLPSASFLRRRTNPGARLIARQARTWLHRPRLPRPTAATLCAQRQGTGEHLDLALGLPVSGMLCQGLAGFNCTDILLSARRRAPVEQRTSVTQ